MNKSLSALGFALMVVFTITGCDTDKVALLTDGVWDFENMTTNSGDASIKALVLAWKAAMTDATFEIQAGGDYIIVAPLLEEPETGTWSLVGDDQLILTRDGGFPSTANIETLSRKELKYIQTYVDQQMNSYSVTTIWVRD
jgi:hypothetical protein